MAVTNIKKVAGGTLGAIALISVIVFGIFYFGGSTLNIKGNKVYEQTDLLLYWTYVLIGLSVLSTVGFAIKSLIESFKADRKNAIISIAGILALVVLFVITYTMGDGSGEYGVKNSKLPTLLMDATSWIKLTDMWIYSTYILVILNVVAVLWGGCKRMINR